MKTLVIEIITCILLLNFANIALATEVNLPPKKIILHNTLDGELDKNPLSCGVKSKIKMKLYEYPEESSAIITELPANQHAQIKGYELHTYPFENVYSTGGQEVYFLSYMGEGRYSVFLDGKVSIIRTETNKIKTNAEF